MIKPVFFKKNRVSRVYLGGKLFDELLGDGSTDGFYPEEWIASTVEALSSLGESEGLSVTEDGTVFRDLIEENKEDMLGPCGKMRILVKYLDSAIRLPAQAHPDRAFSKEFFNSEYGKTESWIILGVREGAKLFFGFKDGVDEKSFVEAIERSETDKDAMQELMLSIEPKVGDVYIVPAKTVHAIGAGCLILEIQEPTDFTIQPERWCGDYKLNDVQMYLGLSREDAVKCFDFGKAPNPKITPEAVSDNAGCRVEALIDERHTPCFVVKRIMLDGGAYTPEVKDSYAVYSVADGSGCISAGEYSRELRRGDYFFIPYYLMGRCNISGNMTLIECY